MVYHEDTMFRSADMSMVQLYIANEIGREIVNALGELGQIQFRDLNSDVTAFQRTFTQEIRRLDNVERQLRFFYTQMEKAGIPLRKIDLDVDTLAAPSASEIDELADRSQSLEQRVASLNDSYETLKKREVELTEWRWVLREAGGFFDRAHGNTEAIRASNDDDDAPLLQDVEQPAQNGDAERSFSVMNIGFVAGVIPRDRVAAFERILWRTLRGNLYMNQSEIPEPLVDPTNNEPVNKNVFVIFAHGKELIAKIRKISESLGADLYSVDENSDLRRDQIHEVNTRLGDLGNVLGNTKTTLDAELTQIAQSLAAWMVIIKKEKAVYQTLNLFSYDHARKTLIAEAWCPTNSLPLIKSTLHDVNNRAGLSVPSIINEIRTNKTPPTYQKTNRFTEGFQTIINAYGTAKYQEVNPGLPTVVTFPFLFAVMFGDFGHGFIMFAAASAMIYWEKPLKKVRDELFSMAYYGRYIMLMMGIFSMYTGLIYNDVFSKSLSIFPSAWQWDVPEGWKEGAVVTGSLKSDYRYPFGLDWMWHGTENDLLFSNSYKMKLSILMGWCHMTYSLCLSYINARHFKSPIDIWGVFVPGMIFFQAIFGYLVFTIIFKWCVDWNGIGQSPPGLLNMLIYMFLSPGTIEGQLYRGQAPVQIFLVLIAIVQVPILLFLKPFYLRYEHNKARGRGYRGLGETSRVSALDGDDDDSNTLDGRASMNSDGEGVAMITQDLGGDEEHEEFEFSEVMIHQVIHTIGMYPDRLLSLSVSHQLTQNRILPQLRLPHRILPQTLGPLPRPSTALRRSLDHDPRQRSCRHRPPRRIHDRRHLLRVVLPIRGSPRRHGGHERHVALAAFALGRGNE
ncbi:H(+)-transporting V0 sector ATPase subunit a, variant 2 [Cadophora gregata]|uniref:H(+)-transporting V0 sector ATPase subunit a, variant 2 n=1 Tax=Cadophora gregata TaxID=51156 RepID=UPI0026DC32F1|nr:H(+)-transporting V0 sector ATPase subunit a, variant 2 [Cadophora gregata]KAK0103796.1 H(+)-transporting V0 sector ATPase subunit a, variant 2 [Cadophora gregata]